MEQRTTPEPDLTSTCGRSRPEVSSCLPGPRGERGFALLIVLWSTVLLSLIAGTITVSARTDVQLARNLVSAAKVEAGADAALFEAAFKILEHAPDWSADGGTHFLSAPDGVRAEVRVTSEDGKVNPNLAAPGLLAALLEELGAAPPAASALADHIVQWRIPLLQPAARAVVSNAYEAAGLDYRPPGAPFRSEDEVGAVLGMTPELFAALRPLLSIYASREPVPAYASPAVRAVMDTADADRGGGAALRPPPSVVAVSVAAVRPDGARFVRHAILKLNAGALDKPFLTLTWEQGDTER